MPIRNKRYRSGAIGKGRLFCRIIFQGACAYQEFPWFSQAMLEQLLYRLKRIRQRAE